MATMTLNMADKEMQVLAQLAADQGTSKTAIMRNALRLYQLVQVRIAAGERMTFSGDGGRVAEFIGFVPGEVQ